MLSKEQQDKTKKRVVQHFAFLVSERDMMKYEEAVKKIKELEKKVIIIIEDNDLAKMVHRKYNKKSLYC